MPDIATTITPALHYEKAGSGPGIVLLHGFPESGNLWRYVAPGLAERFTVITPDFPGSGGSALHQPTSISDIADCVYAILEAEQISTAVIAGHSMGGYVAFDFAARYPERVCGLSAVHSFPEADDDEKKNTRLKAIDLIRNGGREAFLKQTVPALFSEDFKLKYPGRLQEQVNISLAMPEDSLINYYKAMIARQDRSAVLKDFTFPQQWIMGQEDNVIPIKKILPHCYQSDINFVTFYGHCAHMSMLETPGNLVADLTDFTQYSYERIGRA